MAFPAAICGSDNLLFLTCVQDKNTKQIPISKIGIKEIVKLFMKFFCLLLLIGYVVLD
jgi:hypothetical protein